MSDIVERLWAAGHDERLSTGSLYLEAADEIEELRDEIVDVTRQCGRLRQENERFLECIRFYREALGDE